MKDAKGHGSDPRGGAAHQAGVEQIGAGWVVNNSAANIQRAQQILNEAGIVSDVHRNPRSDGIAYVQGDNTIHLNAAHRFWQNPFEHMEAMTRIEGRPGSLKGLDHYRGSFYSSNAPEHLLTHEIAHTLYEDVPKAENKFKPDQVKMIREKVSGYAARNPNEFVAEVHAGMKAGRQYPDEVMQLFKRYAHRKVAP